MGSEGLMLILVKHGAKFSMRKFSRKVSFILGLGNEKVQSEG